VIDLVRTIESLALEVRASPPAFGLEVQEPGLEIALPFERPLYSPPAAAEVESVIAESAQAADTDQLFAQTYVDTARLLGNIRIVLPKRSSVPLSDVIALFPVEQGAAEIIGYLAVSDDDLQVEWDDDGQTLVEYVDPSDSLVTKQARLPKVTVRRS